MHLVQLLIPLYGGDGTRVSEAAQQLLRDELTTKFGGVTAFSRAPAKGQWKPGDNPPEHDDVVVFEVMVNTLESSWWRDYRLELQERFAQDELVVRAWEISQL